MPVDPDLVFEPFDPMAEGADAGMFDDKEDPVSDASEEREEHPCEHPSADALDDPAPSEPRPLSAPSAPPLLEDVTHSQLNQLVDRLWHTPFGVRRTIILVAVAKKKVRGMF